MASRDPGAWALGTLDRTRPTLLCAGLGSWWWVRRPVVADAWRAWVLDGRAAHLLPLQGIEQVGRDERGIVAVSGRRWARFDGLVSTGSVGEPGRPAKERCVPGGSARIWVDEDFVYRRAEGITRVIDVLRPKERLAVGPHGALLAGEGALVRGAEPGRTPRPLPCPLLPEPLRWSSAGTRVAGLDPEGQAVLVDLRASTVQRLRGLPVAVDTLLVGDRLVRGARRVYGPIAEASCARWGEWLAGPAGALWSLREGRRCSAPGSVLLGLTVGTPDGFVTIDWATARGHRLGFDGQRYDPFTLPLDPDDTVSAGVFAEGAVHVQTALGERFRVVGGRVERGTARVKTPAPEPVPCSPAGPLPATASALLEGLLFAWSDEGWLFSWPAPG